MVFEFLTLDDVDVAGKTVFLRVDINSPIDPVSKRILDATKIASIVDTIRELGEARVVLGSHQSRPGKYDFTSLELHTRVLQMYLNSQVRFVDDIIGGKALVAIEALKPGEVLVLDNLRMLDEENREGSLGAIAGTKFVKTLSPYFDLVVNDAFAASHRCQPSLVGFGEVLPMVAGRLMERELNALNQVMEDPERPCIFVLGGAKVEDRLPAMRRVLRDGIADRILVGGLIRETFFMAQGGMPRKRETLREEERGLVDEARELLDMFDELIELPVDVALDVNGERVELRVDHLTDETNIYDIGLNTLARYCDAVKKAGTVVAEGPLGMFERKYFNIGTKEILRAMAECRGFTVVGGGHLGGMASMMDVDSKMGHVSTGGGAMLALLAGEEMPVIEALKRAQEKYG